MKFLYRFAPRRLKDAVKVLLGMVAVTDLPTEREARLFDCPVCGARRVHFRPPPLYAINRLNQHQHVYSIFQYETANIEHYFCTRCSASDRDRLYALYARQMLARNTGNLSLLEIAPVPALTQFLRTFPRVRVRTADLYSKGVDDKIDITNMRLYPDGHFDAFICSHVLEHVADDIAAMKELHRVLKEGGWGIAMVPIHLGLTEILEDPSVTDEAGRWKHFGQGDHVRIYTKRGFVERLASAGFHVQQLDRAFFGSEVLSAHGICPRSVLYVVTK